MNALNYFWITWGIWIGIGVVSFVICIAMSAYYGMKLSRLVREPETFEKVYHYDLKVDTDEYISLQEIDHMAHTVKPITWVCKMAISFITWPISTMRSMNYVNSLRKMYKELSN